MTTSIEYLESLGLKRNPFDPAPLDSTETDMKMFVGRESEIKQLVTKLASTPNGLYRIVIMGTYGVGKTSLLNRLFWEAATYPKWKFAIAKLAGKDDMTFLDFMLTLMDELLKKLPFEKMEKEEQKTAEEIKLNLDYERQAGVESSSEVTGTLSIMIASLAGKLGVKQTEIRTPLPWNERSAMRDLKTVIDIVLKHYNGIILGIDEVDYLASKTAREVLKKGREEIFQHRNFLFVFSGTTRFRALLEEIGSPIREIIDSFIILEPFRYPEERNVLDELVELRLQNVAIPGQTPKCPFDKGSLELIFTLANGVPRRILRFLQTSMDAGIGAQKIVDTELVLSAVRDLGRGHYVGLALRERDVVKMLAKKELFSEVDFAEIRQKFSLSEETEKKMRASLESQGLLNSVFVGKDTYFALAPEIRVYVLHEFKLATPIYQIEAAQKITQTITDEQDEKVKTAHLKTANLLEGQGHLGLLNIEYNSMNKEERISNAEKSLACLDALSDPKLSSIIGGIRQIVNDTKEGKPSKEILEKLTRLISQVKEYSKSVFEPSASRRIVFAPYHSKGGVAIELDEPISYRQIVVYEAMMRHAIETGEMEKIRVRIPQAAPNKTKKEDEKRKRHFWSRKKKQ